MLSSAVQGQEISGVEWKLPKPFSFKICALLSVLAFSAYRSLQSSHCKIEMHALRERIKKIVFKPKSTADRKINFVKCVNEWKETLLCSQPTKTHKMVTRAAEILISRYQKNEKMLDLTSRSLSKIPFNLIENMKKTTLMVISGNPLGDLEDVFYKENLQAFSAKKCEIERISGLFFSRLSNLTSINLSGNRIYEIPEGSFSHLKKLKVLDLEDNNLTELSERSFEGLESLVYLRLTGNKLYAFHERVLHNTPNLRELHLGNNELTQFSLKVLEQPFQSEHPYHIVTLYGNPVVLLDKEVDFHGKRVCIDLDEMTLRYGKKNVN